MSRVWNVLNGLLMGAVVGAGVVLLFAPRSGPDTQDLIRNRVQEVLFEGRQAAEGRRLELSEQLRVLKQSGGPAR